MTNQMNQSNVACYRNSGHRSRSRSRDKHHRDEDSHRRHNRDKGDNIDFLTRCYYQIVITDCMSGILCSENDNDHNFRKSRSSKFQPP